MLVQVVYASAATVMFKPEDLDALLRRSRDKNAARNISGMLLYHEGSFLQVLEGEADAVDALYEQISMDRRHGGVIRMLRAEIEERTFGEWSMGFVDTKGLDPDTLDGFSGMLSARRGDLQEFAERSNAHRLLYSFRNSIR